MGLYSKEKVKKNSKKKKIVFSNVEDSNQYIELFNDSYNKLKINFVDSINESEMIKSGIKGMLKNLDPYTKLLEGSSKESFDILRKGKYGGIGIRIGLVRDTLTVLAPMEDSPAYTEGINSGDQIFKIDSTLTFGLNTKAAFGEKAPSFITVYWSYLPPKTKWVLSDIAVLLWKYAP